MWNLNYGKYTIDIKAIFNKKNLKKKYIQITFFAFLF